MGLPNPKQARAECVAFKRCPKFDASTLCTSVPIPPITNLFNENNNLIIFVRSPSRCFQWFVCDSFDIVARGVTDALIDHQEKSSKSVKFQSGTYMWKDDIACRYYIPFCVYFVTAVRAIYTNRRRHILKSTLIPICFRCISLYLTLKSFLCETQRLIYGCAWV